MTTLAVDARMVAGYLHGIARYSYMVIRMLAELEPNWRIQVLDRHAAFGRLAESYPNLESIPCPLAPLSLREQWALPACLRSLGPDLFHATSIAVPRKLPCPSVVTVPDLTPIHYPRRPWLGWLHRLYLELVLRPACRRARRVLVYSRHSAQDVQAVLGVPMARIEVTPLGVEPSFWTPGPPDAWRDRFGEQFFLTVSNPKPHKNLRLLLQAWRRLAPGRSRLVLVSPTAPWLDRELAELPGVERLFPVAEGDLPGLLGAATALVFPSLYEGFGLPVVEAMAAGTPVLAARAASLPEVVGSAGVLFDPYQCEELASWMQRLLEEPALAQEFRERGREQARAYTWERCAEIHRQVYREALS